MTDTVDQLRAERDRWRDKADAYIGQEEELDMLDKENKQLRTALVKILCEPVGSESPFDIAEAALGAIDDRSA